MNNFLLNTKKVLAVCMETTAGGRNYSGGLGALYGDTTRTMDRLGASYIAVTPLYKNGYVQQQVTEHGVTDEYPEQNFEEYYEDTRIILEVPLLLRQVKVKVWRHKTLRNCYGIDSYLPENGELAPITSNLYGENGFGPYDGEDQRLMQEVILGVAAVKLCNVIYYPFDILHLNEGHGVFAALYMISEEMRNLGMQGEEDVFHKAWEEVRAKTVFTTHTPIAAGNKYRMISRIMGLGANLNFTEQQLREIGGDDTGEQFGSTTAALRLSKIANAVALRHQATSHDLWKKVTNSCPITYIDNGIDIDFWQDHEIRRAFEEQSYIGLMKAHEKNKLRLIDEVEKRNGIRLNDQHIIVGFARRVIAYKRADMIFNDIPRFERLINDYHLQIIFSGKTHPKDHDSKRILMRLYEMSQRYPKNVIFLQNYDVEIAGLMTKGCDVWLGNPKIPEEACSTSGMKAASNGVVNLSTADGWWYRSCRYGVNGWTIGESISHDRGTDAVYLYEALEQKVFPAFAQKDVWAHMMLASIYTAMEECSTERMCRDYYAYLYNAPFVK